MGAVLERREGLRVTPYEYMTAWLVARLSALSLPNVHDRLLWIASEGDRDPVLEAIDPAPAAGEPTHRVNAWMVTREGLPRIEAMPGGPWTKERHRYTVLHYRSFYGAEGNDRACQIEVDQAVAELRRYRKPGDGAGLDPGPGGEEVQIPEFRLVGVPTIRPVLFAGLSCMEGRIETECTVMVPEGREE